MYWILWVGGHVGEVWKVENFWKSYKWAANLELGAEGDDNVQWEYYIKVTFNLSWPLPFDLDLWECNGVELWGSGSGWLSFMRLWCMTLSGSY